MTKKELIQQIEIAIEHTPKYILNKKVLLSADYFLILDKPNKVCGLKAEFMYELPKETFLIFNEMNFKL